MARYFVSYRRDDSPGHAGRVYDALASRFGGEHVHMDVDKIRPGVDFVASLEDALSDAEALIAIIGPNWVDAHDASGRRRLDNPEDFVRLELATALRKDVPVIPVLVRGAVVPQASELPGELAGLPRRHALELTDTRWRYDVGRLLDAVQRRPRRAGLWPPSVRLLTGTAAAVAAALALVTLTGGNGDDSRGPVGGGSIGEEAGAHLAAHPAYQREVGAVCDASNRAALRTAHRVRGLASRVKRAGSVEQVSTALLDDASSASRARLTCAGGSPASLRPRRYKPSRSAPWWPGVETAGGCAPIASASTGWRRATSWQPRCGGCRGPRSSRTLSA